MAPKLILLFCLVSAVVMMTVGWYVQIVHYPSFLSVRPEIWSTFHERHSTMTGVIVVPAMLGELACAVLLMADRPAAVPGWSVTLGLVLTVVAWGSTFFLSVPCHAKLANGYDADVIRTLIATSWPRTISWTAHAGLCTWQMTRIL